MQSDPWWSLAMAVNVFLVFYFHTNPDSFRKRWWIYCLICYGGPFVIALTLLLLRSPRGLVYGGATVSNIMFPFREFYQADYDPSSNRSGVGSIANGTLFGFIHTTC